MAAIAALCTKTLSSDVVRLRELNPRAVIGQTVGAGHFHQLEVPAQVDAMIERFLAVCLPR